MPRYQYACTEPACGHEFEAVQSFSDPALSACPICEGRLRKVFSAVGVVFKGSGFYRNDSRADNGKRSSSKDKAAAASSGDSSASTSSSDSGKGSTTSSAGSGSTGSGSDGSSSGTNSASSPSKAAAAS